MGFDETIAKAGLDIKAIKLRPDAPFKWASNFFMPIYNDNRMFLFHPEYRRMIVDGFVELMNKEAINADVVAGTSTAGIAPGEALADRLQLPFVYIRDKPKDHGLKNQIEGVDAESDLRGKKVLVVEDLISTGGSSVNAVQAVRAAKGEVTHLFSIFNYGLEDAAKMFAGKLPYDSKTGATLNPPCEVHSLLTYPVLLKVALGEKYISPEQETVLAEWRADPFNWGSRHGWHYMRGQDSAVLSEAEQKARLRTCLALDFPTTRDALAHADGLSDLVYMFKVGKEVHTVAGNEGVPIVRFIYERGGQIFVDLKLKDTPQTIYGSAKACTVPGVAMFNLHISGSEKMCKEALRGAADAAAMHGIPRPKVIGVTVLTSLDDSDLAADGRDMKYNDLVMLRAENAKKWGLDGIVCPANQAGALEQRFGPWLYVTPGVEHGGVAGAGQKQLYTADRAVQDCTSSILVLGSAITKAPDKRVAAKEILQLMAPYV